MIRNKKAIRLRKIINTSVFFSEAFLIIFIFLFITSYYANLVDKYREIAVDNLEMVNYYKGQLNDVSAECLEMLTNNSEAVRSCKSALDNCEAEKIEYYVNYSSCSVEKWILEEQLKSMPFIDVAEDFVSKHEYDRRNFNCLDFSMGAVNAWRDMGYNAHVRYVKLDCDKLDWGCEGIQRHAIAIIELPVEVTGFVMPIKPEDFEGYGLK